MLATHLPRPLWARLLTACVGAARVDAQLVVETIGIPNLCEHVPSAIMWACLEEIGVRAIGGTYVPKPAPAASFGFGLAAGTGSVPVSMARSAASPGSGPIARPSPVPLSINAPPEIKTTPPPPPGATQPSPIIGPDIPSPNGIAELFGDVAPEDRPTGPANRQRTPTQQRFRATSTGIGRLAAARARRPQANATAPSDAGGADSHNPPTTRTRRAATESEYEVLTDVSGKNDDWKTSLAVEDEQLVDWSGSEETTTGGNPDDAAAPRKR